MLIHTFCLYMGGVERVKAFLLSFDFVIASVKLEAAIGPQQRREERTVRKSATPTKVCFFFFFFFLRKGKIIIYKYTNYTRPSMKEGIVGWRCDQRLALPRQRAIARRPKRCLVMLNESVEDRRCSKAMPTARMMAIASGHQPPKVSTTTGKKSTPAARQARRLDASLRRTPTVRAWPGVVAASVMVSCCRGEITLTSSAAGRPCCQTGRRMSAGREFDPGTRLGASFVGARAAAWAVLKSTSRIALWRAIRSLLPPQPTW